MWSVLIHSLVRYGQVFHRKAEYTLELGSKAILRQMTITKTELVHMPDTHNYYIEVQGQVDAIELNTSSPLEVSAVHVGSLNTKLVVQTDQSGLLGLVRYLHSRGFILLSINTEGSSTEGHHSDHLANKTKKSRP
jgi:hypothetical protein